MGFPVPVPREVSGRKPPHGSPCNRCGLCCMATLCPLARKVFGFEVGRCPALVWSPDNLEAACGLVVDPMRYAPTSVALRVAGRATIEEAAAAASLLVGSGTGCDARINGEPADRAFYDRLRIWDRKNVSAVRRAKKIWGV